MRHIINALVENKPGVLARIVGLFSARGFNIESLAVGETEDPMISRMTVTVGGDEDILEQVRKQLDKLIDVIKVTDLPLGSYVERDLALIKVAATPAKRNEIMEIANIFRGKVVDVADKTISLEVTGTEDKVKAFIRLMTPYGIKELARTGRIAMQRG
ncbi:MAG: acetolactate synthase small subunit [Planctomycetota bacterium]|jgi:acetolactate synthase-1/3 small subunit